MLQVSQEAEKDRGEKGMNLTELNEHYKLICDLHNAECMLDNLCSLAKNGAASVSGSAPALELSDEIDDMKSRIKYYNEIRAHNEPGIRECIAGIASDQTRLICKLRFLRGLTWNEVAGVIGGGNTADGVRMICGRQLKDHKKA